MVKTDRYIEFNMGVLGMERIDAIIRKITEYKAVLYINGSPMHSLILRLLNALYVEVYPYLDEEEVKFVKENFTDVFRNQPIINKGSSLLIPKVTEEAMEDFELWLMKTMFEKGILTKIGESPYDIEI